MDVKLVFNFTRRTGNGGVHEEGHSIIFELNVEKNNTSLE
jgi:hypothetical protein